MNVRNLILDNDGTIQREGKIIPGVPDAFRIFQDLGVNTVIATNSSRMTPEEQADRYRSLGLDVPPEKIVTSAVVTGEYLASLQRATGKRMRAFCIGENGLRVALKQNDIDMVEGAEWKNEWDPKAPPTDVVVGFTQKLAYPEIAAATSAILNHGARFIATNNDATFRHPTGATLPANGFAVRGLSAVTGVDPVVLGKPNEPMIRKAMSMLGVEKGEQAAIVGDGMEEDVRAAELWNAQHPEIRLRAWLVLTGTSKGASYMPQVDMQFDDLHSVATHMRQKLS
jgi:NagD protein